MKRVASLTFTFFVFAVCLLLALLPVRTHWATSMLVVATPFHAAVVIFSAGEVILLFDKEFQPYRGVHVLDVYWTMTDPPHGTYNYLDKNYRGFHQGIFRLQDSRDRKRIATIRRYILFPGWIWTVLMLVVPAVGTLRILHRQRVVRRKGLGLCATCGYDLRATPDCCPECGRSF